MPRSREMRSVVRLYRRHPGAALAAKERSRVGRRESTFTSGRAANAIRLPVFKARTPVLEAASKAIDRVWYGAEQGRLLIPHRRKASRLARQRTAANDLNGMRWIPGGQTVPPRVLHEPGMRFGSHCSFQREYWEATSLPQPPYQA